MDKLILDTGFCTDISLPDLDQFFTPEGKAREMLDISVEMLGKANVMRPFWIEPSAGTGAFFSLLPAGMRFGIDLEPRCPYVKKGNFLDWKPTGTAKRIPRHRRVVVGNPPFGRRGKMAIEFFNHAARYADTVAFVMPSLFEKASAQEHLKKDMKLSVSERVDPPLFLTLDGTLRDVSTVFQIWTRLPGTVDGRAKQAPRRCADFSMWQYNNIKAARKVFKEDWDFAVPCQGWQDYSRRETRAKDCEKNKQWMLFKARNEKTLERLMDFDFDALARRGSTVVPGFRKNDMLEAWNGQTQG